MSDSEQITGSKREYDTNGWFEIEANPLSVAGVYDYAGRNIPDAPDPDRIYQVFRPPEELESPECLDSFKLMPWIDDHTPGLMGDSEEGYIAPEDYGVHGVIGEKVFYSDGVLYGNIKLWSEKLKDQIASGKKELSLGYRADYVWEPGEWRGRRYQYVQRNLRGNHVASVHDGRMGSLVSVLDSADIKPIRNLNMAKITKARKASNKRVGKAIVKLKASRARMRAASRKGTFDEDDVSQMSLEDALQAVNKLLPVLQKFANPELDVIPESIDEDEIIDEDDAGTVVKVEDEDDAPETESEAIAEAVEAVSEAAEVVNEAVEAVTEAAEAIADPDVDTVEDEEDDETIVKVEDEDDELKAVAAMDAKDIKRRLSSLEKTINYSNIQRRLQVRNDLAERLSHHIGVFDHNDMSTKDVAAYGLKKLEIKAPKGAEVATINGYLAGVTRSQRPVVRGVGMDSASNSNSVIGRYIKNGGRV